MIVLDIADSGYTASSSPTCTSEDVSGFNNLLLGSGGTTTLDCTRDTDGNIEIYGLSSDVFSEGSYQVKLKLLDSLLLERQQLRLFGKLWFTDLVLTL